MKAWQQTVQATMEWLTSGVHGEWRHAAQWQEQSGVAAELVTQLSTWIEAYVKQPILRPYPEIQDVWLALAKQLREELLALLAELEPTQALVLLCGLPSATVRGYSWQRLAGRLHVNEEQLREWEGQAYAALLTRVGEQTPFLLYLSGRVQEGTSFTQPAEVREETAQHDPETQIAEAGHNPEFDLRRHLSPQLELAIRQAYHRVGFEDLDLVKTFFAEEDRWLVELVGSRMRLELTSGEGESEDA